MKSNYIIDEENKRIYADMQTLGKKEVAAVEEYLSKGYELTGKDEGQKFIAPHNMGIQSPASGFPTV